MPREKLDHSPPIGRLDNVADKGLLAEILDFDFALLCERMLQRNDQREFVLQNFRGQLEILDSPARQEEPRQQVARDRDDARTQGSRIPSRELDDEIPFSPEFR